MGILSSHGPLKWHSYIKACCKNQLYKKQNFCTCKINVWIAFYRWYVSYKFTIIPDTRGGGVCIAFGKKEDIWCNIFLLPFKKML